MMTIFYNLKEAARYLKISNSQLYKLTAKGVITHYKPSGKLIYFKEEDLDNWVYNNPINGGNLKN